MNKIKLIILDIDECITPYYLNHVDLDAMSKLQKYCLIMKENKDLPDIILNSGRQVPYGEMVVQTLGLFSSYPFIMESGCLLYYSNVRKIVVNPNISQKALDTFAEIDEIIQHLVNIGANKEVGKELCISLNPPDGIVIEGFFQRVLEDLNDFLEYLSISHSKTAVDITPKGINKSSAIGILEEKTPFMAEEMLAIGDSNSDLDVMALTGFVACPSNANENVRKMVFNKNGYISSYKETKGVVDILEQLIFNDYV